MYTVVCISETIVMHHTDSICGGYMEDWEGNTEKLFCYVLNLFIRK